MAASEILRRRAPGDSMISMSLAHVPRYPESLPRSDLYDVSVAGEEVAVLRAEGADFVSCEIDGPVEVAITVYEAFADASVRPRKLGLEAAVAGRTIRLPVPGPLHCWLDLGWRTHPLYLFLQEPDRDPPSPGDDGVHFFEAGVVHEVERLDLESGETVYLEAGAVFSGTIMADVRSNIAIRGNGVIDGSGVNRDNSHKGRTLYLRECVDAVLSDFILINPPSWQIHLNGCRDVVIERIRQIGQGLGTDGIDVVSSQSVRIRDAFIRSGDDCVAVKANGYRADERKGLDVADVVVEGCVFLNDGGGNAVEIGHELETRRIEQVTFRNCDILCVHGHGAAFSINNAAEALVTGILYEDIRVEHHYEFLFSFRVIESRWCPDCERGRIRNVTARNIAVDIGPCNPGYSLSVIAGFDADHGVDEVVFENVTFNGRRIANADDLDLVTRHAAGIEFR